MKLHAVITAICIAAPLAVADIQIHRLGELAPPTAVDGREIFPLPYDDRLFADVMTVPDGFGRVITFNHAYSCRSIGFGWARWSHGYTGNCYYTNGRTQIVVFFPRGTKAAYFYIDPNPYGRYEFTLTASNGTSTATLTDESETPDHSAGWAFTASVGSDLVYVHISSDVDYAVGEFGISEPCPADLDVDGFVDFTDFLLFLNYYEAADPKVDYTEDGLVDFADYLQFLNWYGNSCEDN